MVYGGIFVLNNFAMALNITSTTFENSTSELLYGGISYIVEANSFYMKKCTITNASAKIDGKIHYSISTKIASTKFENNVMQCETRY